MFKIKTLKGAVRYVEIKKAQLLQQFGFRTIYLGWVYSKTNKQKQQQRKVDVKKKQQLKKLWRFPLWLELRWKFRPQAEKVAIPSSPLRSVLSLVEKKTWLLGVAPQSWGKTETSNSAANSTGLSSPPNRTKRQPRRQHRRRRCLAGCRARRKSTALVRIKVPRSIVAST